MAEYEFFNDIMIVELASFVSGPYAAKLLAECGAQVVKVESPNGDIARRHGPFPDDIPDENASGLYLYLNANKRGVTLDVTTHTGKIILRQMLANADVFIVDWSVQQLEDAGVSLQALSEEFPNLIIGSITPFGLKGPRARFSATGINLYHAGGDGWLLPSGLTRELFPDRQPLTPGGHVPDYFIGLNAGIGLMGALHSRSRHKLGELVDLNGFDALVSLSREHIMWFLNQGLLETRATRSFAFGGCIPCRDGFVEIVCLSDEQFDRLVEMMGRPDWANEERFRDLASRADHGAEVNLHLREWARDRGRVEVFELGRSLGVPIGVFNTPSDVMNSEHEKAREYFRTVPQSDGRPMTYPRQGFQFAGPKGIDTPAPKLSEHTVPMLEELGYTREEVVKLWQMQII